MASPEPSGVIGSPVERLRTLTDTDVTLITHDGEVTGSVLNCTRSSVWLVGGDDCDVVVPLDDIIAIDDHGHAPAA
jgi:sporulation protein YlmC with PRC-barrel domain